MRKYFFGINQEKINIEQLNKVIKSSFRQFVKNLDNGLNIRLVKKVHGSRSDRNCDSKGTYRNPQF